MKTMLNLISELLSQLNAASSLSLGPGITWPAYGGLSIANLPAGVCRWLGAEPPPTAAPPLDSRVLGHWDRAFENVVLLLVDGFGLDMFQASLAAGWNDLPQDSLLAALTSVAPSTTAAALTTLWTGAYPAEHGVVGYELFLKEYGMIANMITHNPVGYPPGAAGLGAVGFNPETFLPVPTLGPHLVQQGVQPYAFIHRSLAFSSLSGLLHQGAVTSPALSLSDLFVSLEQLLDSPAQSRRYVYAYWSSLDDLSHRFGPSDVRVARETASFLQQLSLFLEARRAKGRGNTLFLMTADHGHISTPPNPDFELRNHPELLDSLVMMPAGEARLPFAFARAGREERALAYIQRTWGGRFRVVPSGDFLASGVLGSRGHHPVTAERLGDFVILPDAEAYWYFGRKDNLLLGRHGGLTRTEMLVPLLAVVM